MNNSATSLNQAWADWMVEELARCGVTEYALSSGSRCTPLTVAVARHAAVNAIRHVDERGLAYYATGYARATGTPAAVVTTSGTAVANLHPGVIEASQQRLPMIVITADRPPELRDCGANQAMPQGGIFGSAVRWSVDMPCPDAAISPRYLLSTINHAVARAMGHHKGPVHVNCMFREPLAPVSDGTDIDAYAEPIAAWAMTSTPYCLEIDGGEPAYPAEEIVELARLRGVVVVGDGADGNAACRLAEAWAWPCLGGLFAAGEAIRHGGWIAEHTRLGGEVEALLWLGDRVVGKDLLDRFPNAKAVVQITDHPERQDPAHRVTHRLRGDPGSWCDALADGTASAGDAWVREWRSADETVGEVIASSGLGQGSWGEAWLASLISATCPEGHGLFVGNSMPVRDVEGFGARRAGSSRIGVNRGVSGIDGLIATAVGFSHGLAAPVTALLGDLSALHDLNALHLVARARHPVTVVVVNNGGGRIFEHLPIAGHDDVLDPWFTTPHELTFEHAARQFGLNYVAVDGASRCTEVYVAAANGGAPTLIEAVVDPVLSNRGRSAVAAAIGKALAPWA